MFKVSEFLRAKNKTINDLVKSDDKRLVFDNAFYITAYSNETKQYDTISVKFVLELIRAKFVQGIIVISKDQSIRTDTVSIDEIDNTSINGYLNFSEANTRTEFANNYIQILLQKNFLSDITLLHMYSLAINDMTNSDAVEAQFLIEIAANALFDSISMVNNNVNSIDNIFTNIDKSIFADKQYYKDMLKQGTNLMR